MKNKKIGVYALLMINLIAIDSLRNIPLTAPAGILVIGMYIVGILIFFIPCAIATGELSSKWPLMGGISCWVEEAAGKDMSFFVIWMQWIYNLVWFPSITAFAATQLAYSIESTNSSALILSSNPIYITIICLALFWLATFINSFGMKPASILSNCGALIGTLFPMILIIILGAIWIFSGNPTHITSIKETVHQGSVLGLFVVVLFSLMGLEMSATHAEEVKNPKKDFPKSLWLTVILIPISLILANIAIALVVPPSMIDPTAGLMQSFDAFFRSFNITWMDEIMALTLFLGAFAGIGAWSFGLSRYLNKAAQSGYMPKSLIKTNKSNVPANAMFFQAVIVSFISLIYLWMPTIQSAYWFLSDLTAQLALISYIIFFISAIILRKKYAWDKDKNYSFARKNISIFFYYLGVVGSIAGIIAGFILPGNDMMPLWEFDLMLIIGILITLIIPYIIIKKKSLKNKAHV